MNDQQIHNVLRPSLLSSAHSRLTDLVPLGMKPLKPPFEPTTPEYRHPRSPSGVAHIVQQDIPLSVI